MTTISRIPTGLLGFLGIKNGGEYPQRLINLLSPTWDLASLYLNTNEIRFASVDAVIGTGYNVVLQPNPGEVFVLHEASASYVNAAGEAISIGLARASQNNLTIVNVTDLINIGASTGGIATLQYRSPLVIPAGENFGVFATNHVGIDRNFYFKARYTLLTA